MGSARLFCSVPTAAIQGAGELPGGLVVAAFYRSRAGVGGGKPAVPSLRPLPLHESVYGLAANALACVTVSLRPAPHARERVAQYAPIGRSGVGVLIREWVFTDRGSVKTIPDW